MVQINFALREVNVKIVYYGPGRSGKTTNLEIIHAKAPKGSIGEMMSIATETDRTLFFDFLPLDLGKVAGMNTKFQLYTVPGQVYYKATRKLVLQGADGVVFVADSQADMMEENLQSLQDLEDNLRENGLDINQLPIVFQWNKRDLENAMPVAELAAKINRWNAPALEASAIKGDGVFPTLKALASTVIQRLNREHGYGDNKPAPVAQPAPQPVGAAAGGAAPAPAATPQALAAELAADAPLAAGPAAKAPAAAVPPAPAPARPAPPPPPPPPAASAVTPPPAAAVPPPPPPPAPAAAVPPPPPPPPPAAVPPPPPPAAARTPVPPPPAQPAPAPARGAPKKAPAPVAESPSEAVDDTGRGRIDTEDLNPVSREIRRHREEREKRQREQIERIKRSGTKPLNKKEGINPILLTVGLIIVAAVAAIIYFVAIQ